MTLKDKPDKTEKAVKVITLILFSCILAISLLACIPDAKTAAGRNLFQFLGEFINKNSQPFFFAILLLCILEIVSLLIQYSIKQSAASERIENLDQHLNGALDQTNHEYERISDKIHDLEISVLRTSQTSLRNLDRNRFQISGTLEKVAAAYKDNLRNYYDSNKRIYIIVQKTQLDQIKDIHELIDLYCKL